MYYILWACMVYVVTTVTIVTVVSSHYCDKLSYIVDYYFVMLT